MKAEMQPVNQKRDFHIPFWVILLIAALNGLVYVFLVPPWQHYDEPGHFEYVTLFARMGHLPDEEEIDHSIRRQMAASMVEHDFFRSLGWSPNLIDLGTPPWIGITQLDDQPLYYFLASLPLRIFANQDVTVQLYLARLVSWVLFLVTIFAAWNTSRILFGKQSSLGWGIPLFLGCLPGFVDLMTSINNDVGAIAVLSLYFWLSVWILVDRVNLWRVIGVFALAVAAFYTKSTALVGLLFLPIILLWGVPGKRNWIYIQIGLSLVAFLAFIWVFFDWGSRTPVWYYPAGKSLRQIKGKAPLGNAYLVLLGGSSAYQMLTAKALKMIQGQDVTLGGWIWSDQSITISLPQLVLNKQSQNAEEKIAIGETPKYFSYTVKIPEVADVGWVYLNASDLPASLQVYYDGLVLSVGEYPVGVVPLFTDMKGRVGSWNGKGFENLLRNGSAETALPIVSEGIAIWMSKRYLNAGYFWSLFDFEGSKSYLLTSLRRMVQTFWGYFGWAHVPLMGGERIYLLFSAFTIVAIFGILAKLISDVRKANWKVGVIFTLVIFGQLWLTIMRHAGSWFSAPMYPVARYFFPAILPFSIGLCWGWSKIFAFIKLPDYRVKYLTSIVLLEALNIWAWLSIYGFYYGGNNA